MHTYNNNSYFQFYLGRRVRQCQKQDFSLIKYCNNKCNVFIFTSKTATKTKHKATIHLTYQNKCLPE